MSIKRTTVLLGAAVVALVTVVACQPITTGCIEFEYGDCSGGAGQPADTARVVGFPSERVDSVQQGQLHVGESINLHFVLLGRGPYGVDTSRTASWALSAQNGAGGITSAANGAAQLTAIAPGSVEQVLVNGRAFPVWSCGQLTCTRLSRITVVR